MGKPARFLVSLTSIPPRFGNLPRVLGSLLDQDAAPDRVVLYLPRVFGRFAEPWRLPEVPDDPRIEVRVVERDLGPLTKIAYAVAEADPGWDVVACDDDQSYPRDWLARFVEARVDRPDDPLVLSGSQFASAPGSCPLPRARYKGLVHRLRRILEPGLPPWSRPGYVDIAEGWAGICVKPAWFGPDFMEIPDAVRYVDDVWVSAYLASRGRYPWLVAPGMSWELGINTEGDGALNTGRFDGLDRDGLNARAVEYLSRRLGVWG